VCELALAIQLLVVTICKWSINPINSPNPVYSHTHIRDNMLQSLTLNILISDSNAKGYQMTRIVRSLSCQSALVPIAGCEVFNLLSQKCVRKQMRIRYKHKLLSHWQEVKILGEAVKRGRGSADVNFVRDLSL
jgi:hypothetical protein